MSTSTGVASAVPGPWVLPEAQDIAAGITNEGQRHAETEESRTLSGETDDESSNNTEMNEKHVNTLARTVTQASVRRPDGDYLNPFTESHDDPRIDPRSDRFNARAWTKTLMGITSRDPERYPTRTAGVAYRSLNVHGYGNPTDYQKTFGNYPLELPGLINKWRGKGQRKIQILQEFEGLVKSGEMLVVLGRPGSGCSTFLKTISGETSGFFIDDKSEINYQVSCIWSFGEKIPLLTHI